MKLVAQMIVRNELGRYLVPAVESLLEFCDEIRVVDDGSTDGTYGWLRRRHRAVKVARTGLEFNANEGNARQAAFEWACEGQPSHILAIDADEFVADGRAIRAACEQDMGPEYIGVWKLCMLEVWNVTPWGFETRTDGGWNPHPVPILYALPRARDASWRIPERKLASGREPVAVRTLSRRTPHWTITEILHLGWANEGERRARYDRYRIADGGRFHSNAHLDSILWRAPRVDLCSCPWPHGLAAHSAAIARIANR